jgi:hypothetical protein
MLFLLPSRHASPRKHVLRWKTAAPAHYRCQARMLRRRSVQPARAFRTFRTSLVKELELCPTAHGSQPRLRIETLSQCFEPTDQIPARLSQRLGSVRAIPKHYLRTTRLPRPHGPGPNTSTEPSVPPSGSIESDFDIRAGGASTRLLDTFRSPPKRVALGLALRRVDRDPPNLTVLRVGGSCPRVSNPLHELPKKPIWSIRPAALRAG